LEYEPSPIQAELVGMVIEDPCGLLATLTRDTTVSQRVLEQNWNTVTLWSFFRDILEPYLLNDVGKRFQEA